MTGTNGQGQRVALYARASTDKQAHSIPGQLQDLREHAAAHGLEVVEEISDVGEKRHDLTRPGLDRLRDLAETGAIREVWAWEYSRFGSFPAPEILALELRDFGVELRSLDDSGPGEDGEDLAVIKSLFSRREQRDRVRRASRGRGDKSRRGEVHGGFRARYGFRFITGTNQAGRSVNVGYEVDPEQMLHVRRIFQMVADGESLHAVQKALEQGGIPNPTGGPRWSRTTLRGIVQDDVFRPHSFEEIAGSLPPGVADNLDPEGVYGVSWSGRKRSKFAASQGKKRTVYETPRSEWTAIPIDLTGSGLDRGVVDRARAQVEDNKAPSKAGGRFWELSGVAKCAECGRNLIAYRRAKKGGGYNLYYRCRPSSTVDACPNRKSHPAEELEYVAARTFQDTASRGTLIAMFDAAVEEESERAQLQSSLERRTVLTAKLSELESERTGYLRQNARGVLTDSELDAMLADLDTHREGIAAELRRAEDATAHARRIADARQSLLWAEWLEDPDTTPAWEPVPPEEFPTLGASREQLRAAYNRYGVRFEVGRDGKLTLRLDLDLSRTTVAERHNDTTLCPPAAATSSARLAYRWPATSARSSVPESGSLPLPRTSRVGSTDTRPARKSTASRSVCTP